MFSSAERLPEPQCETIEKHLVVMTTCSEEEQFIYQLTGATFTFFFLQITLYTTCVTPSHIVKMKSPCFQY